MSTIKSPVHQDQASELRSLIEQNTSYSPETETRSRSEKRCRTIAVCSGKGGVGKSLFSLNLAIALSQLDKKVCLLDANQGLGNLDLLCGLNGYWNLSHVLTGVRQLKNIVLQGPEGISLLPGASELSNLSELRESSRKRILSELTDLEQEFDYFIVDNGSGISKTIRHFAASADTTLLLTTMETTSLADTYAALKTYKAIGINDIRTVFNQTEVKPALSAIENLRKTAQQFLQCDVNILGCIPDDPLMQHSVSSRIPLLSNHAESSAGIAIQRLAYLLDTNSPPITPREKRSYVNRLYAGQRSASTNSV